MSDSIRAFVLYQNKDADDVVLALELTEPLIHIMENTLGLEDLAKISEAGDFVLAFDCRVVPGNEFREHHRPLQITET